MKRTLVVTAVGLIGLGYFLASPLIGLAHLQSAIAARNAAALAERVDFPRLRRSLGEQIVVSYLKITGKGAQLGPLGTSLAAGFSGSLAEPLLNELLNPETVLDLLSGRGTPSLHVSAGVPALPANAFGSLLKLFANCEYGIGNFYISVPSDAAEADQFRLRLQVLQWNWTLTDVGLPERLRVELAQELARRIGG